MARAVRLVSLERGLDPRGFTLMAFGGAGPMHAAELAEEIGIDKVVIPPAPGLFSALGLLLTDMKFSYVMGLLRLLDEVGGRLGDLFREMERRALEELGKRGLATSNASTITSLDLRYYGQGYELEVPVSLPIDVGQVARSFEERHEAVYGYRHEGERIEVTALRLTLTLPVRRPPLTSLAQARPSRAGPEMGERRVFFEGSWVTAPIYSRELLPLGATIPGPAIIEEYDSTVVLPPRWSCTRNEIDCLILSRVRLPAP
jgi:N-methylhydantoinase A